MRRIRSHTSLVAAVVGAFILALTQPPIASAAASARTTSSISITSASVRVFATGTQSFTNTGIAFTTIVGNGTVRTFHVNNSGNLGVDRFTMTITLPANSNISAFRRCALNVSFTGTNLCASGTSTNVTVPASGAAVVYLLSLPANSFYSFQIVQNKAGTITVSTSASLSNVTGTTTNS